MLTKRSLITIEAMRNAPQLKLVPKSVFNVVFCKLVFTTSPPALSKGEGAGVCSLNVICEIGVGPHPPPSPRERELVYAVLMVSAKLVWDLTPRPLQGRGSRRMLMQHSFFLQVTA